MKSLELEDIGRSLAEAWQLFAPSWVVELSRVCRFHDSRRITATDSKDISML